MLNVLQYKLYLFYNKYFYIIIFIIYVTVISKKLPSRSETNCSHQIMMTFHSYFIPHKLNAVYLKIKHVSIWLVTKPANLLKINLTLCKINNWTYTDTHFSFSMLTSMNYILKRDHLCICASIIKPADIIQNKYFSALLNISTNCA